MMELFLGHTADPAVVVYRSDDANTKPLSILHLAAVAGAPEFGELERLFDRIRQNITQPYTRADLIPLHVALASDEWLHE